MRNLLKTTALSAGIMLAAMAQVQAQNTTLEFTPGNLIVLRGGDGTTTFDITNSTQCKRYPTFLDEYNTSTANQSLPLFSTELPTNGPNAVFFNMSAGSEGQGISRSLNRQFMTFCSYNGTVYSNTTVTPSSTNDTLRGFCTVDAFTNFDLVYASQDWFGIPPNSDITQNNPRGIATDGTNDFWGCGSITGTAGGGFAESGTEFWSPSVSGGLPYLVQNQLESAYNMRIIGGVLYMVGHTGASGLAYANGLYDFVNNANQLDPLPELNGEVEDFTNLYLNFGSIPGSGGGAVKNVLAFDMDPSNTTCYAADNSLGIVKYTNGPSGWNMAYYFSSTNIGTLSQKAANQGCFGIAVDFSGANPVIYATTMEAYDKGGDVSSNRLIKIVDTGNPGITRVDTTLAVAQGILEGFRGLDFSPDLRPYITSQPAPINTTTNVPSSFSVTVQSAYPVSYQWQLTGGSGTTNIVNSSNIGGATTNVLSFAHSSLTNQGNYIVIVTNVYGAVTSSVASMIVTAVAFPPGYTTAVLNLTNYVGANMNITATPISGTPPFSYQWYYGSMALVDGPNPDNSGSGYTGSTNSPTLTITNLQPSDAGDYYLAVTNDTGGTNVEIATLTVLAVAPSIPAIDEPATNTEILLGGSNSLTVTSIIGSQPLYYQWYQGNTNPVTPVNGGEFGGAQTNQLQISPASMSDATNYFCVITNIAGSTTSLVASVTVIALPPPSYLGYSNQVYTQNFNSLPNLGVYYTNTINAETPLVTSNATYDFGPSAPYIVDFAAPILLDNLPGGLGLSGTMSGWYGYVNGNNFLGVNAGDYTTGGLQDFGPTNSYIASTNRALGILTTGSALPVVFAVRFINESSITYSNVNVAFTGELWRQSNLPKTLAFAYYIDPTGSAALDTNNADYTNLPNLYVNFPTNSADSGGVPADGTQLVNETNINVSGQSIAQWAPGTALWLIWQYTTSAGKSQGIGIDNFSFSANATPPVTAPILGSAVYAGSGASAGLTFSFTDTPGAASSFSIWSSTNLLTPFNLWTDLGHPTEGPAGTYSLTDPTATNNPATFYRVTSP